MKAAVVQRFDQPPTVTEFPSPEAGADEVSIRVEAAALSQLARGQASGRHYSSGALPFVPGTDGVGRLETGERVYFAFPRAPWGAMAEQVVVDRGQVVALPPGLDPVAVAAIANPAMSSWAALRERARLVPGERVLVNGGNGMAGRLAIRIARLLGASRVVVTARQPSARGELEALGADSFIHLGPAPEQVAAELQREIADGIGVVLDYLWGAPAEWILQAVMKQASTAAPRRVRFVNIGSLAGTSMALASAALRSSRVELLGSGLGSVPRQVLAQSAGAAVIALGGERLGITPRAVPIDALGAHWNAESAARTVFVF